jgi:hypothetical protein
MSTRPPDATSSTSIHSSETCGATTLAQMRLALLLLKNASVVAPWGAR